MPNDQMKVVMGSNRAGSFYSIQLFFISVLNQVCEGGGAQTREVKV